MSEKLNIVIKLKKLIEKIQRDFAEVPQRKEIDFKILICPLHILQIVTKCMEFLK